MKHWPTIRKWLTRGVAALTIIVIIVASVVLIRTCRFTSRQLAVPGAELLTVSADEAAARLAEFVRIQTVTSDDGTVDANGLLAFHARAQALYPRVHESLEREIVADYSLLYTWRGSDPSLRPIILAGHMDVVPVEQASRGEWLYDPFSGAIVDGYIWGRGTLDDKHTVIGLFEAVELLLAQGVTPKRTFYLAFGHDEEGEASLGAHAIAALLQKRGVRAEMAMDEGMLITEGIVAELQPPVAVIGISEKGYANLELIARTGGGHSSMPPEETAIGALGQALERLQQQPMPATIDGAVADMLAHIGPEMPFVKRMAMANLWLFESLVISDFTSRPSTNATIRTTIVPTVIEGGTKANVLPSHARAVLNARIKPGDTVESVVAHLRRVIDDDNIEINVLYGQEPSPISDVHSRAFKMIHRSIKQVIPDALVSPALMVGMTDGRLYRDVADDIFRFVPTRAGPEDLTRIHGVNERITVANYAELIQFYGQLIRNLDADE